MKAVQVIQGRGVPLKRSDVDTDAVLDEPAGLPGRPMRPLLVAPAALAHRSLAIFGAKGSDLRALADYLLAREY